MIKGKIKFSVNKADLRKEIINSASRLNNQKQIENSLYSTSGGLLVDQIKKMKEQMIKEFMSHPITKEILAGPNASNTSGTLGGYGNLFSFIGFESGSNPIQPIIELLQQTNYRITRMYMGKVGIHVEIPSKEQIFKVTPLPWAPGISWAERIEIGLSGLGQYMYTTSRSSRSGKGVQSSNAIKGGSFRNTKYISHFINSWHKKFLSIASSVNKF
jgi:hypothetical protein